MSKDLFTSAPQIVDSSRILYTASSFARSSLLHLQECGALTALQPHTSSRSGLSSYLFFIVTDGEGELVYDKRTYVLKEEDCVFIDCGRPYSHSTPGNDTTEINKLWSLKWIHFTGPTMSAVYSKYLERGGRPRFKPKSSEPFLEVFESLFFTAASADYMRDMLINEKLSSLVRLIMAESWHPEDKMLPSKKASVLQIKAFLDEKYMEKITLDDLCSRFFISKHYLTHSFKEQFGTTISNYLSSVRITHAKQLLRFSNLSMEEISLSVGITDPAYFSRLFSRVEGISPSEYRRQW